MKNGRRAQGAGRGEDRRRAVRLGGALAFGVFFVLLVSGSAIAQEKAQLTVLFTSDMHAWVLPFDDVRQRPIPGSVAQVATLVERMRKENPRTVVLDGGDEIEGTPLEYYAIAAGGAAGPDPAIAAMNVVGYDAAVVGNHEFNFGLDVLRRSLGQARFPWLAANLVGAERTHLPVTAELVIKRGGVRIGVLGLTNPNVPHWDPPEHWAGLEFLDPVEVAKARLSALRARSDVVIVVAHSGFERDLQTGVPDDSADENFAWRLAQLDGIDLLLTGHTHRNIPPRALGKTVVAQPGRRAEVVTRVDLELVKGDAGWRVSGWRGENLTTADAEPSPAVVEAVSAAERRTVVELSRPLGSLTAPLRLVGLPTSDDPGVDLIHAVQLEASGAQLSLAAPFGGGRVEFPAGPVTPRLAYALYPYPNALVVVRVTGAQLKDVLEHAVRGWQRLECGAEPTLLRDPDLPPYSYDTVEGATYLVDPTAPVGQRIRGLRVGGRPVQPEESFTLAINSYRAAGGGGFPHLASAPRVKEIARPMVDLISEYFTRHGSVTPRADDNWAFTLPLRESPPPRPAAGPR